MTDEQPHRDTGRDGPTNDFLESLDRGSPVAEFLIQIQDRLGAIPESEPNEELQQYLNVAVGPAGSDKTLLPANSILQALVQLLDSDRGRVLFAAGLTMLVLLGAFLAFDFADPTGVSNTTTFGSGQQTLTDPPTVPPVDRRDPSERADLIQLPALDVGTLAVALAEGRPTLVSGRPARGWEITDRSTTDSAGIMLSFDSEQDRVDVEITLETDNKLAVRIADGRTGSETVELIEGPGPGEDNETRNTGDSKDDHEGRDDNKQNSGGNGQGERRDGNKGKTGGNKDKDEGRGGSDG